MRKIVKYSWLVWFSIIMLLIFNSCEDFLEPDQEFNLTEDKLFDDWYEYRSVEMGLYLIQQDLVEQIMVLGELRGDLLTITENADPDLIEINNFNVSKDNKYASPVNFFKLISACNSFIKVLEEKHPEVTDKNSPPTNYDRLYGEAICMRAWAYFNAVRIYGKVPFIPQSLTSIEEVESFLNTPGTYIDSIQIVYNKDGYNNDTIYNTPVELQKQFYNQDLIIDYFTNELETKVKDVGVLHYIDNNDYTWEVTTWSRYSMNALLGIMYLTAGDLAKAAYYFEKIVYLSSDNYRYQLDNTFGFTRWKNIFNNIDRQEHIYTIWFNKANLQQNQLQRLFDPRPPHLYMLKPTANAILNWEASWDNFALIQDNSNPQNTKLDPEERGRPGDFYRGYGVSYIYTRNGESLPESDIRQMLLLRADNENFSANLIIENAQEAVWKYSWNKNVYDQDADFIVYRAAGVHLWLAEVYTYWLFERDGRLNTFTSNALNIVNNGSNYEVSSSRRQLGVRGRVGFGDSNEGIRVDNINYIRDSYTNEVTGYIDLTGNFPGKQQYLEEQILQERALELAFEGERFYDLIRVSKRRNDPSFLAKKVSSKYSDSERDRIYNLLLDEKNWYINYFE